MLPFDEHDGSIGKISLQGVPLLVVHSMAVCATQKLGVRVRVPDIPKLAGISHATGLPRSCMHQKTQVKVSLMECPMEDLMARQVYCHRVSKIERPMDSQKARDSDGHSVGKKGYQCFQSHS
jgi:hypothetical protein